MLPTESSQSPSRTVAEYETSTPNSPPKMSAEPGDITGQLETPPSPHVVTPMWDREEPDQASNAHQLLLHLSSRS
ncbi:hypothetical protein EX30DRAFT_342142 [Ascodesmis nigricans]|uniref:Uncharacterized protein n=1 Tax=Ascodesmis nigricans TaxID=341454 RepID=A0A4S2MTI3_9PEZI|nr:hypothetical protein EX30DRAFT_342142 [Ascodesmis nigricans]